MSVDDMYRKSKLSFILYLIHFEKLNQVIDSYLTDFKKGGGSQFVGIFYFVTKKVYHNYHVEKTLAVFYEENLARPKLRF